MGTTTKGQSEIAPTMFQVRAQDANTVFLAGTFNGWDPAATPMESDTEGCWTAALLLAPGRYEYKFVVDGEWCCNPGGVECIEDCPVCVPNPFGTLNCTVDVRG